jgi:hypothetical protein
VKRKIVLLVALFSALSSIGFAQAKRTKTAVAPNFTGSPEKQKAAFKSFIIRNIGKRVFLKLTFSADEPHAYRSEYGDPVFSVDSFAYFFMCGDNEAEVVWTARCMKLNWNAATRTITGYFKVTEPEPKLYQTNRQFLLTPTR